MHTRWLAGRTFTAVGGLLVMAGVFAGTGPAVASAANCQAWTGVPSPSPGSSFNELNGVRVVSASDAWAVGAYGDGNGTHRQTLVLHWNGATWTQVASPDPGGSGNDNYLFAVAATSHSDALAVGE